MDLLPVFLAALLVAGFVQGATGFGFGLLVMSVLPLLMDVHEAVPMVSVLGLVLCLAILWRYRKHADPRKFLPLLAGEAVGTPIGVLFLTSLDSRVVTGVLGAFLVLYAGGALRALGRGPAAGSRRLVSRRWGPVAGLLGGVIGGALNTGGPPVIVYANARGWEPGAFKANLQVAFLFNTAIQLTLFAWRGLLTPRLLRLDLLGLPVMLAGILTGFWASSRLDAARFRRLVLVLLLAFGVVFLVRTLPL